MYEDVFEQVLRFLHKLGVDADIGHLVIASAPFRMSPSDQFRI